MNIQGFSKTSLLDYPGHLAAVIFTADCNFRCPFCHNSDLVLPETTSAAVNEGNLFSEEEILTTLRKRANILEGVCITGGEPTLWQDLPDFIKKVREIGYKVKLDTNGYRPDVLRRITDDGLADYVAMDIKNCLSKYPMTTGVAGFCQENISESIEILKNCSINYEFRTTVVREFHTENDLIEIARMLEGCRNYFLQSFKDSGNILKPGCSAYSDSEMINIFNTVKNILPVTQLRGIDIERTS